MAKNNANITTTTTTTAAATVLGVAPVVSSHLSPGFLQRVLHQQLLALATGLDERQGGWAELHDP